MKPTDKESVCITMGKASLLWLFDTTYAAWPEVLAISTSFAAATVIFMAVLLLGARFANWNQGSKLCAWTLGAYGFLFGTVLPYIFIAAFFLTCWGDPTAVLILVVVSMVLVYARAGKHWGFSSRKADKALFWITVANGLACISAFFIFAWILRDIQM